MSLFKRSLLSLAAVSVLGCLLFLVLVLASYSRSADDWQRAKGREISEAALALLRDGNEAPFLGLGSDVPAFVYGPDGALRASTRGAGRRRALPAEETIPVRDGGSLIGYLSMGKAAFRDSAANRAFLDSTLSSIAWAAAASLAASLILAFLLARSVALPAKGLAAAIAGLARGERGLAIASRGPEELRQIAASAEALRLQLRKEADLRTQWVQDVVHDLRTPVAALGAQLEAMADGVLPPDAERMRRLVSENARLGALVSSLEELMRLEAPELAVSPAEAPLAPMIADIVERFAARAAEKNLAVETRLEAPTARADAKQLERALSNVIGNAVEYAARGGRIEVRSRGAPSGATAIEVVNSGSRLAPGEEEKVFERLYRGEYARGSAGAGLGLSIARRIARLHSGDLTAENSGPDSVTFRFTLPGSSSPTLHPSGAEPLRP